MRKLHLITFFNKCECVVDNDGEAHTKIQITVIIPKERDQRGKERERGLVQDLLIINIICQLATIY